MDKEMQQAIREVKGNVIVGDVVSVVNDPNSYELITFYKSRKGNIGVCVNLDTKETKHYYKRDLINLEKLQEHYLQILASSK